MRKYFLVLVTFMLIIGILAACNGANKTTKDDSGSSSSDSKKGGTLIVGLSGDPQTFNPDARADDNLYPVAQNVFSRLIKINNNQEIIPDLAKEWEFNNDGTEITFYLHENVKWHDGEDFTSADVKFTLDSIKNNNGYAVTNLKSMQEVTTPDDNTVVIKLSNPDATFLGYLAWYATFILPEHIYSGDNWDSGTNIDPIGTGPFKFSEYSTSVNVTLTPNADYFGQVPFVDKLIFSIIPDQNTLVQSFYNGEVDILGGSPPSSEIQKMKDNPNIIGESKVWPSRQYLVFNFESEPFDKLEVRQAIAYALNNEEIVSKAMKGDGQVAEHFLSPVYSWALSDEYKVPEFNPEKAKDLLEQAGYTPDKNGNYLSITFDVFESGANADMGTVIKDQLRKVGIEVELNILEYATWQQKVKDNADFQLSMLGGYQGPDIGSVFPRISSDGSNNLSLYSNPELDKLLAEGVQLVTEEDRKPKYQEIQRILSEDLPIYPISEWVGYTPVHSYIKGDPASAEAIQYTGFSEYNYVKIEK